MTNFDHFLSIPQFASFAEVAKRSVVGWGRSVAAGRVGNAEEELDAGVFWVR